MASKPVAMSMLLLRILALAASVAAVAVISTDNVTFEDGTKWKFQDLKSYRFVLAVAAISAAYGIVQLPFAIFYAIKQKRLISNGFSREFDFYGDKVMAILVASGIGVGLALSVELKKFFDESFDALGVPKDDPTRHTADKFLIRGIIASSLLCLTLLCFLVVSSINRSKKY